MTRNLAIFGLLLFFAPAARAAQSYQVNAGTNQQITEHSVCRDVINAGSLGVFVPTNTAAEWTAFYNNPPVGTAAASCETDWYNASWGYRVKITVDHTKVGADLTNYPLLITESGMPATFWSRVNATGTDLVVTAEDGLTKLDRELVAIGTGSQTMELYARVPTLKDTSPTVVFLYYGNAGASETNAASTWSAYRNVYHMTATTPTDSTGTTTTTGSSGATVVLGKIGSGLSFSSTGKIDFSSTITGANFKTLSFWYYPRSQGGGNFGSVFGSSAYTDGIRHLGTNAMSLRRSSTAVVSTSATFNTWKHLLFAYNSGSGQVTLYENGTGGTATTLTGGWYTLSHLISVAADTARAPDAILDEMRITNTTLSSGWATTEYNNQVSPGTFYSVGSEVPKP